MKLLDTTTDTNGMEYSLFEEESKFGNFRIITKDLDSGGVLPIVFYKDLIKAQAALDTLKHPETKTAGKIFVPV